MNVDANLALHLVTHVLLLPPMSLFLLVAGGLALRRRWPRTGAWLSGASLLALFMLCTDAGGQLLIRPLERRTAVLAPEAAAQAQAIVVLAAGSVLRAPEYGGDVPDHLALARLRYGARLQHATGLPLLVSGGNGSPDGLVEAKALGMARALREDFRTPVRWVESRSETTAQNAAFSAQILHAAGVRRILLVTDAVHMVRAQLAFEQAGLAVTAAPTMFRSSPQLTPLDWLPSAAALQRSCYGVYEWVGLAWYRLRGQG